MKARNIMIAAALAALTLLVAGCKKHSFFRIVPGEQIRFRAESRSNSSNVGTRTVYSGEYFAAESGGDYLERIDWVEGDMISIGYVSFGGPDGLCADVDHYRVSGVTADGQYSKATLAPTGGPYGVDGEGWGGNGLQWRNNTQHRFLATHPAVDTEDEDFKFEINAGAGQLEVLVPYRYPETQVPVGTEEKQITFCGSTATATVYKPDMSYAYLFCNPFDYSQPHGTYPDEFIPTGSEIKLPFVPHFTAFEITAAAKEGDSFTLNSVTLSSADEDRPLTGTYIFQRIEDDENPDGERWTDVPKEGEVSYQAKINFSDLTLTGDSPVVFTYLLNSWYSFTMLTLTFNITKDNVTFNRSLKLKYANDNWIWFSSSWKHRIKNLRVPVSLELGTLWYASDGAGNYLDGGDPFDGEI
ncbi:MAG: hypothetical protein IJS07_02960 [Bacteroidales bacterium]|nr:hypothetical protein [Bacteroidales bacterium]